MCSSMHDDDDITFETFILIIYFVRRIPKGCKLRCQVVRRSDGMASAFPTFLLINEEDNKVATV
jgi:hypothetical protein